MFAASEDEKNTSFPPYPGCKWHAHTFSEQQKMCKRLGSFSSEGDLHFFQLSPVDGNKMTCSDDKATQFSFSPSSPLPDFGGDNV